ncbi:hypothetical protein TNCV_4866611 [Trichonephila clavipes]|nr:hypothetical protein TNCV_4866611 [Trichonephila clavipes]
MRQPSLWEALPEQDLTFDDYVLVDTGIAVAAQGRGPAFPPLAPALVADAVRALKKKLPCFLRFHWPEASYDILQGYRA